MAEASASFWILPGVNARQRHAPRAGPACSHEQLVPVNGGGRGCTVLDSMLHLQAALLLLSTLFQKINLTVFIMTIFVITKETEQSERSPAEEGLAQKVPSAGTHRAVTLPSPPGASGEKRGWGEGVGGWPPLAQTHPPPRTPSALQLPRPIPLGVLVPLQW